VCKHRYGRLGFSECESVRVDETIHNDYANFCNGQSDVQQHARREGRD